MSGRRGFLQGLGALAAGPAMAGRDYYAELGVPRMINAAGAYSALGGARMRQPVVDAMRFAATNKVKMRELHDAVGARIAELVGAEAAAAVERPAHLARHLQAQRAGDHRLRGHELQQRAAACCCTPNGGSLGCGAPGLAGLARAGGAHAAPVTGAPFGSSSRSTPAACSLQWRLRSAFRLNAFGFDGLLHRDQFMNYPRHFFSIGNPRWIFLIPPRTAQIHSFICQNIMRANIR